MRSPSAKVSIAAVAGLLLVIALVGILWEFARERGQMREHAAAITGGDPSRGESLFIQYGCGSCHAVKEVRTATGLVGPPLDGIATRVVIAGRFSNRPDNMQRW